MKTGVFVGIPITLLQWGVHTHTGAIVDVPLLASNFLLGHAVYDADRMTTAFTHPERTTTRLAAFASTAILSADPGSLWAAPLVPLLHAGYTPAKPILAPIKPFFVAAMWTLIVYYIPISHSHVPIPNDITAPATIFLFLSTLSHVLDVADIEEDVMENVTTPAVQMGRTGALAYTSACALATVVVHSQSPISSTLIDLLFLGVLAGAVCESKAFSQASVIVILLCYATVYDVELLGLLLRSTEASHRIAITTTLGIVDTVHTFPIELKRPILEATIQAFKFGDYVGSGLIKLYEAALRGDM
jgi:hypothetical protein